jgi:hypothetical protein
MVLTPRVWPILIGFLITRIPESAVKASVLTALIAPTGISQHEKIDTHDENTVAKIVCAAGT